MPKTVPLSRPLKTHSGEVSELVFNDLTAKDIIEARMAPVKATAKRGSDEVTVEYRYDIVARLAAASCGHDELLLESLTAKDFHKVTEAVVELWNASGE